MLERYLGPTADEDHVPQLRRVDDETTREYNTMEVERDRLRAENEKLKAEIERKDKAINLALTLLRRFNDSMALQVLTDALQMQSEVE